MSDLAELLRDDLGQDFPVLSGNAKKEDPLIITELIDYIGIEYAVAEHVFCMLQEEYQLAEQRLYRDGEKTIDELVFYVRFPGDSDWRGIRRFFFDISAGFMHFTRSLNDSHH